MKQTKTNILLWLWNILGVAILLGFFVYSCIIGGTAEYCEEGVYYIANHGELAQVSEAVYVISCIWEALFWVFIPLTPLGGFLISHVCERIERRKKRLE